MICKGDDDGGGAATGNKEKNIEENIQLNIGTRNEYDRSREHEKR